MSDAYEPIIQDLLKTHARPGVCLYRDFPPVHPVTTMSKFGGWPNLPNEIEWPRGVDPYAKHFRGRSDRSWHDAPPLHFLAQIDCSELPDAQTALPRHGMLYFFGRMDEECVWEDENPPNDSTRVVYVADFDRNTPLRQPPKDIWAVGTRELVSEYPSAAGFDEGMAYGPSRIVVDANELAVVPEWPMKSSVFETYPDPQHFSFDPVEGISTDEKYAFGRAYGDARSTRIAENLTKATGYRQPVFPPLKNMSHYESLARQAYEKNLWQHVPGDLKQTLQAMPIFVQTVAAHLCHALVQRQKSLARHKERGTPVVFEKLQEHLAQARKWLQVCAKLSALEPLPEKMSEGFIQFLDQLAQDTYSYDYERAGTVTQVTSEVVKLVAPYRKAMIELGRRAAKDAALYEALSERFFGYLHFISDGQTPLAALSHATPHQMLGHVTSYQNPLPLGDEEVMLLHLYSDGALRFCWWDVGAVTFRIKATDLRNRAFEKAWATIQG